MILLALLTERIHTSVYESVVPDCEDHLVMVVNLVISFC